MLKYFTTIGLIGMSVVMISCNKKYCYDCTTERYEVVLPENTSTKLESKKIVHCDQTQETIKVIEQNGTKYTTFNKNGKVHQEHMITKCTPY